MSAIWIEGIRFESPREAELACHYGRKKLAELKRDIDVRSTVAGSIQVRRVEYAEDLLTVIEHHLMLLASTPSELRS